MAIETLKQAYYHILNNGQFAFVDDWQTSVWQGSETWERKGNHYQEMALLNLAKLPRYAQELQAKALDCYARAAFYHGS